jgi:squalene-hopene/tetraprenyl-beta-curcumene cyclase
MCRSLAAKTYLMVLICAALNLASRARAAEPLAESKPQYQFEGITIDAATADEPLAPALSVQKAVGYLDQGALAWSGSKKCVTCHTNGVYLTVRPALTARLGPPDAKVREFFVETLKQKQAAKPESLKKGTAPEQVIYLAAGLAEWDRHVTGRLSPETDAALKLMLAIQRDDGTWGAAACWPPYESDSYQPATVAAMALAAAPGWLENVKDESLRAAVARLKKYLTTTEPPHDYGRVVLLWASTRLPGILDKAQQAKLVDMLLKHQRADGGWSIRNFARPEQWGSGNRAAKLEAEPEFADPPSDGHMTGLALVVLAESGLPKTDKRVQAGLDWLKTHQRASGRWWTRSLNTDKFHFITFSGTAYPLLALSLYNAWPAPPAGSTAALDAAGGR